MLGLVFVINSVLLGVGLAMDAFSVSMANGLNDTKMTKGKSITVSAVFGLFQAMMPMLGWVCVHTVVEKFEKVLIAIPWIALILLSYIGIKMIRDGLGDKDEEQRAQKNSLTIKDVIIQAIATSIDALSVGFTIAEYKITEALVAAIIIAVVTFVICVAGVEIGKKFGTKLSNKAQLLGGIILICIGVEIFVSNFFK